MNNDVTVDDVLRHLSQMIGGFVIQLAKEKAVNEALMSADKNKDDSSDEHGGSDGDNP